MYIKRMRWLLFLWLAAVIVFAFVQPAPQQQIGETSRIFYFHVPCAWVCVVAFLMTAFFSILYLSLRRSGAQDHFPQNLTFLQGLKRALSEAKKETSLPRKLTFFCVVFFGNPPVLDSKAALSAQLGLIFCALATISGAIWARFAWGAFWNWDPRETSIFLQLLIYLAYFSLRGSIGESEKRATFSSAYAILAFLTVPFLIFIVPRITSSLHPSDTVVGQEQKFNMGPTVSAIFYSSLAGFTLLYYYLYRLGARIKLAEMNRKGVQ